MIVNALIFCGFFVMASADAGGGSISGVVVNASADKMPAAGAQVVLRAMVRGEILICGETAADREGRFVFQNLPLGEEYTYLPGANREGVHFPGPRLQLTDRRPSANVELAVCDCVTAPSPLIIRRQDVSMQFQPGALSVTESIIVDNPTQRCYVGASSQKEGQPITLQLAIPPDFKRTTFQSEFFGRRFAVSGDRLATSVPWMPGRRELKFTYVLPIKKGVYLWQRSLDLPCEQLRISIQAADAREISCNLAPAAAQTPGEIVYQSGGEILPKGRVIRVGLGSLPVPFMSYARWLAVAVLATSFFVGGLCLKAKFHVQNHGA